MSETPRYATLRDYLKVIKDRRWLILGIIVAFTAAGYIVSALQTAKYTAETSLQFREIGQDLAVLGQSALPELAPDQRAAINAQEVTDPQVTLRVKRELKTDLTVQELQDRVSAKVGTKTNLVIVSATDTSAEFAARLANAYADQIRAFDLGEVRSRIDAALSALRQQLKGNPNDQTAALRDSVTRQRIGELETLKSFTEPVQIVSRAGVPSSPSSPRTARTTVLGALVGLAFGLLAAFLRDSLDRRLRQSDEVQAELQLPVVGRVPEEALGEPGFALNGAHADEDVEAHLEAFRMLRTNLEFLSLDAPMKTVLVTSGLPEEGKSTVAIALAGAAAVGGKRTLLVECDLRRPCFADRLGLEPGPGLTDYLLGQASPQEILNVVKLSAPAGVNGNSSDSEADLEGFADMVCITAGSPAPLPAEMLGSERFAKFLEQVSKAYDFVILDSSPILPVVDSLELVRQVDGLLVCVRLAKTTREEARAAHEALRRVPERPTGLVVTGVRRGQDSYGYYYGAYATNS